jgi:hypothetical protein
MKDTRYPEVEQCTWRSDDKCTTVSCRYNLISDRPRITDWAEEDLLALVDALPSTCALDFASRGAMRIEEVATLVGLPRLRLEQTEMSALRKLARSRALRKVRWDSR